MKNARARRLDSGGATAGQIGFIHSLAGKAGMDEDMRRDFLQGQTGKRSTKEITIEQAAAVIDKLKTFVRPAGRIAGLDTPLGRKLRALWIAAYDLGLARDRSDKALVSFIERQTGLSHPRFAQEPGAMAPAIEGLKRWIERDRNVAWPLPGSDARAFKAAIVSAQWLALGHAGALKNWNAEDPFRAMPLYTARICGRDSDAILSAAELDKVQAQLGRMLRKALAAQMPAEAEASEP